MFKSLRHRLLFWFLVFVSSNVIIIVVSIAYVNQREEIDEVFEVIEYTHKLLLEDYKVEVNFFTQDIRNNEFYKTGTTENLDLHGYLVSTIQTKLSELEGNRIIKRFGLNQEIRQIETNLNSYDSLFKHLISLIRVRGYKNNNKIGLMRDAAHKLESTPGIDLVMLLSLRRHEKDYLLRDQKEYVILLNKTADDLKKEIKSSAKMSQTQKDEVISVITTYVNLFNEVVELDKVIGLNNHTGLSARLESQINELGNQFDEFLIRANSFKEEQFVKLKQLFWITLAVFVVLGIWVSFLIASKVTKPLTELTTYITQFVDSNFTYTGAGNIKPTKDEIGKLTLNFNVMRDKIIEQLQFFKQKVEERTAELAEANRKLVRLNEANSRFVPREFLENLNKKSIEEVELGDNVERQMTVLFSDIRGFTKFSEQMTPQENFDFINAYLKQTVPLVKKHNGFIDKYIGDSVMALFPGQVEHAIDSAVDSQNAVRNFNHHRMKSGQPPITVGIGMHTGNLILGTIGEENRMETTVISDAVNTASRMEGLTSIYGGNIIISQNVVDRIQYKEQYRLRYLDTVMAKGKEKSIAVYEVLDGQEDEEVEVKLACYDEFLQAIEMYRNKNFEAALRAFSKLIEKDHKDQAYRVYYYRCDELLKNGVPDGWDATIRMTVKKRE